MHLIGALIIGFIIGLIARFVLPGRDPMGIIWTTVLGIIGSVVATWLGRVIGLYGPNNSAGLIASVVGAVVVLAIYHMATRRRGTVVSNRDRWAA